MSDSISTLLTAESEAKEKLMRADVEKRRIHEGARRDGQAELAKYQTQKQAELQDLRESLLAGSSQGDAAGQDKAMKERTAIERASGANQQKVVATLLAKVLTVQVPVADGEGGMALEKLFYPAE
eukprot:TRINITY_DN1111_c4_g2_i4.p2 TRINITY_DN1111_c4_g2~~TRINITY_DN1111_c4_g2_i4.p2  ORF type:complete len:125 (+),score=44.55 TRINITY_DN1111_c4_g2_i4:499-873(+)